MNRATPDEQEQRNGRDDSAPGKSPADAQGGAPLHERLPKPIVKKMRWPYPLIWLVPICAAIGAGYYFYAELKNHGPTITLSMSDASGIKAGETAISRLGVTVGLVKEVTLTSDQSQATLKIQLNKSAAAFAQQGARFWVVRPEISAGSITGLNTITSGPYIEAAQGYGPQISEFAALPRVPQDLGSGLMLVLHAPRLEHLQPGSSLSYRGIEIGAIQRVDLSQDSTGIDVKLFVHKRYTALIRQNSKFWITPGVDLKGGLFSGVQFKLESLRALISGGITVATPDEKAGPLATDGDSFPLYSEPKGEWSEWSPRIELPPANSDENAGNGTQLPQASEAAQSATK